MAILKEIPVDPELKKLLEQVPPPPAYRFFPACKHCGGGSLLAMPKVQRDDPVRLYCSGCRAEIDVADVNFVRR